MSQADIFQSDDSHYSKAKKYCRTCWREDFHFEVINSALIIGFLTVATFGLVLLARPKRCVCCGTMRIF